MVALLLWPKLFDGWMLVGAYRRFGDGDKHGKGQGDGDDCSDRHGGGYGRGT